MDFGVASLFSKFGFTEPDGRPIKVTTHQFRHYLNTLAQAGGMIQLDIAKWSGRKDVRQNSVYDHMSATDIVMKIRESLGDDHQLLGQSVDRSKRALGSRDEFSRLKVPTAHSTDFGYCIHDFTIAPCQIFSDCINCTEQVCIKGDEEKAKRIKSELIAAQDSLKLAELAQGERYFGANRWVDHHKKTVVRLTQLCEILDNPDVPAGAVIQLSGLEVLSIGSRSETHIPEKFLEDSGIGPVGDRALANDIFQPEADLG